MSAGDGSNESRDRLQESSSILADLERRVGEGRTRAADAFRSRVRTLVGARESLADCQELVREAGAYATVADTLLQLGQFEAAEVAISIGFAYVDAAKECLDAL